MSSLSEALENVEKKAGPEWNVRADAALLACARENAEFISDDVWSYGIEAPTESRALGPVFIRAKRDGIIVKTDRMRYSALRPRRASPMPIWKSLVFGRLA